MYNVEHTIEPHTVAIIKRVLSVGYNIYFNKKEVANTPRLLSQYVHLNPNRIRIHTATIHYQSAIINFLIGPKQRTEYVCTIDIDDMTGWWEVKYCATRELAEITQLLTAIGAPRTTTIIGLVPNSHFIMWFD